MTPQALGRIGVFLTLTANAFAQYEPLPQDQGDSGVALALRKLKTTISVLYVTAHPDDENNALVMKLSRGLGYRVGLLTLTRGDGGQNEIGPELFEALGVLRTEELMRVHRFDGAQQFFGLAYEFGYSFSVEETLEKWGKEKTLGDIVYLYRLFRPDIVLTMMPTGEGGGQHHQASARLAMEAFKVAADPSQYRELLGSRPWQAKKLYHVPFVRKGDKPPEGALKIEVGDYDPALGMSYAEFGALARRSHRCQGMNVSPVPGPQAAWLVPGLFAIERDSEEKGIADGLVDDLVALCERLATEECKAARASYVELSELARSIQLEPHSERNAKLFRGVQLLEHLSQETVPEGLGFLTSREGQDWKDALRSSLAIDVRARLVPASADAPASDGLLTRGEKVAVEMTLLSRTGAAIRLHDALPFRVSMPVKRSRREPVELLRQPFRERWYGEVLDRASYTQPFWYRESPSENRFTVRDTERHWMFRPFGRLPLEAAVVVRVPPPDGAPKDAPAARLHVRVPVLHTWYDPMVARERAFAVKIVPGINVRVSPRLAVVPRGGIAGDKTITVSLRNNYPRAVNVTVGLEMPEGWPRPVDRAARFERENEEKTMQFRLLLPDELEPGEFPVQVVARVGTDEFREGYQTIAYHHIETRHLYHPAKTTLKVFDVDVPDGLRVGYVMGVGDDVPQAMENLGVKVTLLNADDLASGDLSRFDVMVTGIRAYKDRHDLIANNGRLLDWVESGGTMLVQYNKYELNAAQYGPYPFEIARPHDRITDENAPVKVLDSEHPVFNSPNRIGANDWNGWVQERGLYFLREWDERYVPLLEMGDPFPYNPGKKRGGLVVARYGKGIWVYTGIGFFRQLPAGVPGAYRLWANLLALGKRGR